MSLATSCPLLNTTNVGVTTMGSILCSSYALSNHFGACASSILIIRNGNNFAYSDCAYVGATSFKNALQ